MCALSNKKDLSMQIQSHLSLQPKQQAKKLTPKQKIEQAIFILQNAEGGNQKVADTFVAASKELEGAEPHMKAIKFDRPSIDVSEHGTELREQADSASDTLQTGANGMTALSSGTVQSKSLIESAIKELKGRNSRAAWRLESAFNDVSFLEKSTVPVIRHLLNFPTTELGEELDPYLAEVEADEPGRDVGHFADDIQNIWNSASKKTLSGPIYTRSATRSIKSALGYLELAKTTL